MRLYYSVVNRFRLKFLKPDMWQVSCRAAEAATDDFHAAEKVLASGRQWGWAGGKVFVSWKMRKCQCLINTPAGCVCYGCHGSAWREGHCFFHLQSRRISGKRLWLLQIQAPKLNANLRGGARHDDKRVRRVLVVGEHGKIEAATSAYTSDW